MACDPQPYIAGLVPYQPGLPIELVARKYGLKPADIIKLASNENPLGMSPKARAAIDAAVRDGHRYPDNYVLEQALAAFYGVDPSWIAVANGSTGVLDLITRSYIGRGCEAISSQYAFIMYQIMVQTAGGTNVIVPAKEHGHDLNAMLAAITPKTSIIWITNPNNPTGTFVAYSEIRDFLVKVPSHIIVVLDEAYYEYLEPAERPETHTWPATFPNVVIVRTFSKVHGLAGIRAGYAIADPAVAELLNRVRYPFIVNAAAVAGAAAALTDTDFIAKSVDLNRRERAILLSALAEAGLECMPAYGNFITFRCKDAAKVCQLLLERGIIVRPLAGYGLTDWLRVSIGLPAENARFITALTEICKAKTGD